MSLPAVGEALPGLAIDITARLVVAGAIATRDYQDVHHDQDAAQRLGTPDIFMNIMTTQGLVNRYVSDWLAVGACIEKIAIRLGVPNFPGDVMQFSGEVASVDAASGQVAVDVVGRNGIGDHVTGQVQVRFPVA